MEFETPIPNMLFLLIKCAMHTETDSVPTLSDVSSQVRANITASEAQVAGASDL